MRVAILGFDLEGRASYDYYQAQAADITICDQNPAIVVPAGVPSQLGPDYLKNLDQFDILVRTAGLPPAKILEANPTVASKITSNTNEFLAHSATKNIIGVTGTKGKGTTSSLIYEMLKKAGKTAYLAGNIGVPALTLLPKVKADDWVVLELSSFQLSDLRLSPHISVCLMVVPEHLNWHEDFADYQNAKGNVFSHQGDQDIAIYFADSPIAAKLAESSPGQKLPFYKDPGAYVSGDRIMVGQTYVCSTKEIKLLGRHNWQNVCAAITAVWQVTKDINAIRDVLISFTGLVHRLEFVRTIDGVDYYDDSYGTTPETAIVAIQSFDQPKVLILGGSDKGATYGQLALAVIQGNVRAVIAIGDIGPKISHALQLVGFENIIKGGNDMPTIVGQAKNAAKHGEVVLLSTASASFGLFKDYQDRGDQFKAAVKAL